MKDISLELPLIGVELLDSLEGLDDVTRYHGASYCDAVRLATYGEDLLLEPGCIEVCKWSPVILGMKEPDAAFETKLAPTVGKRLAGVRVAQLPDILSTGRTPDVVIARGRLKVLDALTDAVGEGALQSTYRSIDASALGEGGRGPGLSAALVKSVNRMLSFLRRSKLFDRFTKWIFRSTAVTGLFDRMIRGSLADMSICRNSTVIPFLEDAGNVSFFCTGGIAWGCNPPDFLTAGFPYGMIERVIDRLDFPGKGRL